MEFQLKDITNVLRISRIANVHFFEFPKGHKTQKDRHPFVELVFVNVGSLEVSSLTYNGKLAKNEMILHGQNCEHSLICPANSTTSVIIIGFECFSEKLQYFTEQPIALSETEIKQLAEIVKEGRNVFAPPYNVPLYNMKKKKKQIFGCEQLLQSRLESFFIGLIRKHERVDTKREHENAKFDAEEILQYVNANYLERITIDELAFLFRTNRSTLCKEFKKATGKTLIEYVNDKKLEKAKQLLIENEKSVTQISEDLNFDSLPYFCKFFRNREGVTPKEYREKKLSL